MIVLTKLDNNKITVNSDMIENVETSHDSTITLSNGKKFIVKEDYETIIEKTISYKQKCFEKILIESGFSSDKNN